MVNPIVAIINALAGFFTAIFKGIGGVFGVLTGGLSSVVKSVFGGLFSFLGKFKSISYKDKKGQSIDLKK